MAQEVVDLRGKISELNLELLETRRLMLQLIVSLTFCDEPLDVSEDIRTVLARLGYTFEWHDYKTLRKELRKDCAETLYGPATRRR
jgi:hypothetical protein